MLLNRNRLCAIILIINAIAPSNYLFAKLTTLQHYDPSPIYSANDSMMPPNSQFLDLKQARFKHEVPNKKRRFGVNISGFIQGANQANGYAGGSYGTVVGIPENGYELGDFRGTMYAMGVFLGYNPKNGRSIWDTGTGIAADQNCIYTGEDTGNALDITDCSIQKFGLPPCLTMIAEALSGNTQATPPNCTPAGPSCFPAGTSPTTTGLVFSTATSGTINIPSIFSASALAEDTKYFGAFSMPILYRKQGLRLEFNLLFSDDIALTIQTGVVNIRQKFAPTIANSSTYTAMGAPIGETEGGPYSISNVATSCAMPTSGTTCNPTVISPLYTSLNQQTPAAMNPNAAAQAIFNEYICNNLYNIVDPVCGINRSLCSFDEFSMEDVRFILNFQHAYEPTRFNRDDDEDDWPDMIFTPYLWLGGTFPAADTVNYRHLLALPFGNNGHPSVGGGIGMTFDFIDSVEVGFEGGATYFFSKDECRPFPTHPLQRILYPFETTVNNQPGINWHVKALLHAYQFLKHVNFWFTYELIEHQKDCYRVLDDSIKQYFYPSVLECKSDWRGQFFNAAIVFDIQPGIQASVVWQQPITPRNAYYPVSILGSINFMF